VISTPLPLFPLRLVLLPGAVHPLHIFEPRYRALIRDITAGATASRQFGLITPPDDTSEADLPAGRIGCVAQVISVEALPDGRSNIVIEGGERFRFETFLDANTPYRVGHVSSHDDSPDNAAALAVSAAQVRDLASRVITATIAVHDAKAEPPEFEADDSALSFQVAHLMQLGDDRLYSILAERSPLARLRHLFTVLESKVGAIEGAAELHSRAKTNGHHHGPPPV
jgi:Lon protease-like protein